MIYISLIEEEDAELNQIQAMWKRNNKETSHMHNSLPKGKGKGTEPLGPL